MANVFGQYDDLISNLSQNQESAESASAAVHSSKAKSDDMAKTVGEAKELFGFHGIGTAFKKGFTGKMKEKIDTARKSIQDKIDEVTKPTRDIENAQSDANDILARGVNRLQRYADKVRTGESTAFEDAGDGISMTRSRFQDADMGESGTGDYDITNGLSADEQAQIGQHLNTITENAGKASTISEDSLNVSRIGAGEDSIADTLNAARTLGSDALKTAGETIGKTVAKQAASEAIGESISAGLDAIPGVDVIGALAGAIVAGVEGHKEHKEIKEEGMAQATGAQVTSQVGMYGN